MVIAPHGIFSEYQDSLRWSSLINPGAILVKYIKFLVYNKTMDKLCDKCGLRPQGEKKPEKICGCKPKKCCKVKGCCDSDFLISNIPAALGDDTTGQDKPADGAHKNAFIEYDANGAQYVYDSNGVYRKIQGGAGVTEFDDLTNRPKYDGTEMTSATDIPDFSDDISALNSGLSVERTNRQDADNNLQSQIDAITVSSDVTDIVGTYAQLQAYDTSKLKDNDIIKVLQDESRDDETTYYRWNNTTGQFVLIGEEGPYYTKAAADTLLANKLDTSTTFWGQTASDGAVNGNIVFGHAGGKITFDTNSNSASRYLVDTNATTAIRKIFIKHMGTTAGGIYPGLIFGAGNNENLFGVCSSGYLMAYSPLYMGNSTIGRFRIQQLGDPTNQYDATNKQYVDNLTISYAALNGASAPTTATEGKYVGQLYLDTTNDKIYYLASIDNTVDPIEYNWSTLGGGGIPTDATFWGASYDAVNNKAQSNTLNIGAGASDGFRTIIFAPTGEYSVQIPAIRYNLSQNTLSISSPNAINIAVGNYVRAAFSATKLEFKTASGITPKISNISDPTEAQDAATKNYVDTAVASAGASTISSEDWSALWQ